MLNWKHHTHPPLGTEPLPVLIAFPGDGDCPEPMLAGSLYIWAGGEFRREDDGSALSGEFYWVAESDVVAGLPGLAQ